MLTHGVEPSCKEPLLWRSRWDQRRKLTKEIITRPLRALFLRLLLLLTLCYKDWKQPALYYNFSLQRGSNIFPRSKQRVWRRVRLPPPCGHMLSLHTEISTYRITPHALVLDSRVCISCIPWITHTPNILYRIMIHALLLDGRVCANIPRLTTTRTTHAGEKEA